MVTTTTASTNVTRVSVREATRNFTKLYARAQRGEVFSVMNRNEEVCGIVPPVGKKKKYTIDDFLNFRFTGPKNMSKTIDDIVYGKRKAR